jgi:hypothetical protein
MSLVGGHIGLPAVVVTLLGLLLISIASVRAKKAVSAGAQKQVQSTCEYTGEIGGNRRDGR